MLIFIYLVKKYISSFIYPKYYILKNIFKINKILICSLIKANDVLYSFIFFNQLHYQSFNLDSNEIFKLIL